MTPLRPVLAAAVLVATLAGALTAQESAATYRVDFDATWSFATHPSAYPSGAHFSPLVGATHDADYSMWAPGGIATNGIEVMAETGGTLPLGSEILAAMTAGDAGQVISGGAILSPGATFATFTVTPEFPLVSLVTMIAPSPDWFVGVHDVSLLQGGQWVDGLSIDLYAYDSGTDAGTHFTAVNANVNPHVPIALITGGTFTGATSLGTFTFTRMASTLSYGCVAPRGSLRPVGGAPAILPGLGTTVDLELADPSGTMGTPSLAYWSLSSSPAPGFPCGVLVPGLGLAAPGADGELLLGAPLAFTRFAGVWNGAPVTKTLPIPADLSLLDVSVCVQGILIDGSSRVALTSAVELHLGL